MKKAKIVFFQSISKSKKKFKKKSVVLKMSFYIKIANPCHPFVPRVDSFPLATKSFGRPMFRNIAPLFSGFPVTKKVHANR